METTELELLARDSVRFEDLPEVGSFVEQCVPSPAMEARFVEVAHFGQASSPLA